MASGQIPSKYVIQRMIEFPGCRESRGIPKIPPRELQLPREVLYPSKECLCTAFLADRSTYISLKATLLREPRFKSDSKTRD
jgi:hypothetical protein